ncbi:MAG TPA: SBBP repeat-containing protein, partial [bacterium]|nr:SBBP repeat-containing protein [bacterium]
MFSKAHAKHQRGSALISKLMAVSMTIVLSTGFIGSAGCSKTEKDDETQKARLLSENIGSAADDYGYNVVVDNMGNVYLTGATQGILTDPNNLHDSLERILLGDISGSRSEEDEDYDAYLIKYNADGSRAWIRQWGTVGDEGGYSLSIDPFGDIYVLGMTTDDLWEENTGAWDLFVEKYSPAGERKWGMQWGSDKQDTGEGIATDINGAVFVVGNTLGVFGEDDLSRNDGFITKISNTGVVQWTKQWNSTEDAAETAHGIALYGDYAFVVGDTTGTLQTGNKIGGRDCTLMKFDKNAVSAPDWVWVKQWGTASDDFLYGIAMDRVGNIHVSGITAGTIGAANIGGKDMFVQKYPANMTASSSATWTRQLGSTANENVSSVTVDIAGVVYVAGTTLGNYDGNTNSGGSTDFFFTKFSSSGTKQWSHQKGVGGGLVMYTRSTGIDPAGRLYITGHTGGTQVGSGLYFNYDVFLYKYVDNQKNWVFTREFGTTTEDKAAASATDGSGNTYVTGYTFGALQGTNLGGNDAFLIRYNSDGSKAWTRQWGSSALEGGAAIAIDADRNIVVAGVTAGSLTDQHGQSLPYSGSYDLFVAKFSPDGSLLWMKEWGTTAEEWVYDVHVGKNGKIYLTGYVGPSESRDGFITALSDHGSSAVVEWSQIWGTASYDTGYSVTTDSNNNIFVSGRTAGTMSGCTSAGGTDNVLLKYDVAGTEQWHRQWGSSGTDHAYAVALDKLETALYVSGITTGVLGSANLGNSDAFLQKLDL